MTSILVLSDLHLEERPCWRLPDELPDFDVAVFAGDIAETPREAIRILATATALAGRPVLYVPGNHEFFSGEMEARLAEGRAAARGTPVTVLDRKTVVLGGVNSWAPSFGAITRSKAIRRRPWRSPRPACGTIV